MERRLKHHIFLSLNTFLSHSYGLILEISVFLTASALSSFICLINNINDSLAAGLVAHSLRTVESSINSLRGHGSVETVPTPEPPTPSSLKVTNRLERQTDVICHRLRLIRQPNLICTNELASFPFPSVSSLLLSSFLSLMIHREVNLLRLLIWNTCNQHFPIIRSKI